MGMMSLWQSYHGNSVTMASAIPLPAVVRPGWPIGFTMSTDSPLINRRELGGREVEGKGGKEGRSRVEEGRKKEVEGKG